MKPFPDLMTPEAHAGLPSSRESAPPEFDMSALAAAIKRNGRGLVLWVMAFWILASLFILTTPAEYTAQTQVLFKPALRQRTALDGENMQATLDSAQADSRLQVIKSERLLRFVFDTLQLAPAIKESVPATSIFRQIVNYLPGRRDPTPNERYTAALLDFINRVTVRRIGLSYVVETSFRAPSAAQAAHVANSITAAYIRDIVLSGQRDTEMLERRIVDVRDEDQQLLSAIKSGEIPSVDFADADARIISAAIVPLAKSYPQPTLILVFATAVGLLAGLSIIFVRHNMDHSIRTRGQVRAALGLRCLASIPGIQTALLSYRKREETGYREARDDQLAALRPIVSELMARKQLGSSHALGIVSLRAGEGTSWVAYNLSVLLATCNENVVLVDANGGRPALSELFRVHDGKGFVDAMQHQDPAQCLSCASVAKRVRFLPFGISRSLYPEMLFEAEKAKLIVNELRTSSHILVDLPAMVEASSVNVIGSQLDGVICVVEAGRCSKDDLIEALRGLDLAGVTVIGIILNKTEEGRRGIFSPSVLKAARVGLRSSGIAPDRDALSGFPLHQETTPKTPSPVSMTAG